MQYPYNDLENFTLPSLLNPSVLDLIVMQKDGKIATMIQLDYENNTLKTIKRYPYANK